MAGDAARGAWFQASQDQLEDALQRTDRARQQLDRLRYAVTAEVTERGAVAPSVADLNGAPGDTPVEVGRGGSCGQMSSARGGGEEVPGSVRGAV